LPDLPYLAELPDRGVGADMIGRSLALLVDIFGEVVPSGWRVTRRPGRDTRRATDFLEWDLDAATEHYAGADWVKVQVCGPWTLAAQLELATGNRALVDAGAVDDIAASLSQGLLDHVGELERRLPGTSLVVQIDEPSLPAVIAGVLSIDLTEIGTSATRLDPIGELVEAGTVLLAGLVPGQRPPGPDGHLKEWAAPVLDVFDRLGFPRETLSGRVVPTPTCGLVGADQEWAVAAMKICRELSHAFEDLPEGW